MTRKNRNKYILIGIPDCGKSTLGRRVAETLNLPFYDTDLMACERLGIKDPIDQLLANINGSFVIAMQKVVDEIAVFDSAAVIATGAEVALMPDCAVKLRQMGTIVHIRRKSESILTDIANGSSRFVLRDMDDGTEIGMRERTVKLYAKEISQYDALADVTLENDGTEDEGLEKLLALIKRE